MKIQLIFAQGLNELQKKRFRGILKNIRSIESLQGFVLTDSEEFAKEVELYLNAVCTDYGIKKCHLYVCNTVASEQAVSDFIGKEKADITLFYGNKNGLRMGMKSAAELSLPCYTDVIDIIPDKREYRLQRKVYNTHADGWYKLSRKHSVILLLPSGNGEEDLTDCGATGLVSVSEWKYERDIKSPAEIISREKKPETGFLDRAEIVFIGGRGLKNKENLQYMIEVADKVGAAWGCTRAVALAGWCDYNRVIGVSGTQISPKICVLFGVSGAAPFLFGIEHAKTIIAINKDRNAPIFGIADYGIIKDCIPMIKKLKEGE